MPSVRTGPGRDHARARAYACADRERPPGIIGRAGSIGHTGAALPGPGIIGLRRGPFGRAAADRQRVQAGRDHARARAYTCAD